MFVKATTDSCRAKQHSAHKAVCDRKSADVTMATEIAAIICKQPTVSGRRLEM